MRMGRVSWLTRRPLPPVTHTHALFADQSHSIRDNLMALLGHSRAWNCSGPERMIRRTRDRQYSWLAEIVKLAPGNVRFSIAANVKRRPDHLVPPPSCAAHRSHGALASLRGRRQAAS